MSTIPDIMDHEEVEVAGRSFCIAVRSDGSWFAYENCFGPEDTE